MSVQDISISLGADASDFLSAMREMVASVTETMSLLRQQISTATNSGNAMRNAGRMASEGIRKTAVEARNATTAITRLEGSFSVTARSFRDRAGATAGASAQD